MRLPTFGSTCKPSCCGVQQNGVQVSEVQDNVRRQERQVKFGRIAAGLVHDLSHPIQNIGNNRRLIVKLFEDHEYRATFRRAVDREFNAIAACSKTSVT